MKLSCPPARYKQVDRPADKEDVKSGKVAAAISTLGATQARCGPDGTRTRLAPGLWDPSRCSDLRPGRVLTAASPDLCAQRGPSESEGRPAAQTQCFLLLTGCTAKMGP